MVNWDVVINVSLKIVIVFFIIKEIPGFLLIVCSRNRSHRLHFFLISLSTLFSFPNYVREKIFENNTAHFFTYCTTGALFTVCLFLTIPIYFKWEKSFQEGNIWFLVINGVLAFFLFHI